MGSTTPFSALPPVAGGHCHSFQNGCVFLLFFVSAWDRFLALFVSGLLASPKEKRTSLPDAHTAKMLFR